jgi:diaminopimelate decarboxylase
MSAPANRLSVGGLPLEALADRFGTPLYVYDAAAPREAYARMRRAFPRAAKILFSLKANPNPSIVAVLREAGAGAEVASIGELEIARRCGIPGADTVFAGPGKTDDELRASIAGELASVNVESRGELDRLARLARAAGQRARAAIRVNPSSGGGSARVAMGGRATAFGVDEEAVPELLRHAAGLDSIELVGIHLFLGTQVLEAAGCVEHLATGVRIARLFREVVGRPPAVLDLGLGLGVPLFANDPALDLDECARLGAAPLAELAPETELVLEAGRFLVAEAGTYVATVLDRKVSHGQTFVVLDGGMNHHVAAAGGFGNSLRRLFPIRRLGEAAGEDEEVTLVGPCCTTLDQFGSRLRLPNLEVGARIAIQRSGAYGYSVSPLLFLSHPTPAEVLVDRGDARLIRERRSTAALFATEWGEP